MRILIIDPTYPDREEDHESFALGLRSDLKTTFSRGSLAEVDAGPSASIPAFLLDVTLTSLAILSAPQILRDNLHLWKQAADRVINYAKSLTVSFAIDIETAVLYAASYLDELPESADAEISIVSCHRQWINLNGAYSETLTDFSLPAIDGDLLENHLESVKQVYARYIICLSVNAQAYTIVIERDGSCSLIKELW